MCCWLRVKILYLYRKTYYRPAARCTKAPQKFRLLEKIYQMLPLDMKYLVISYSLDQSPKLDHRGIERCLTYVVKFEAKHHENLTVKI